ncbi:unnamed protein product [Periconia digitata]|uniref:Uncharacterized protein n=1 Tax=Periconia digitata TaxID=1303443 RepID=A0A9W4U933_9PLEO|nr:unnamed protein product [Periconia digitata]
MCFGNTYEERTKVSSRDLVREEHESKPAGFWRSLLRGCSDDEFAVVSRPRTHRRHGRLYYPEWYYHKPPRVALRPRPVSVVHGGVGYGRGHYVTGGRVPMPSAAARRTYYHGAVAPAPGYSYAFQTMAPAVGVVNPQVPVVPVGGTPMNVPAHHNAPPRTVVQHQNQVEAMRRGAYNPRLIRPADARPDDPFWCQEVTGEWHLRSFYQIENECQPGEWLMNPNYGFLCFHRR